MPDNLYRRGKTWWGRIQVRGREVRRSLRTADRAEAKKRRDDWLKEMSELAYYGEAHPTYKEAAGRWCAEYLPGSVSEGTAKRYLVSLRQLKPHFDGLKVREITRRTVAGYISERRKVTSNATIRRDLTTLSSILSFCIAQGWRDDNPAKEFDRSIIKERREPIRPPSDADLELFFAVAPAGIASIARFLLATGMRAQEAVTIERGQIDARRAEATLIRTKTNRPRVVPLSDLALGTVSAQPRHISSPYVFWHGDGLKYRNYASRFSQVVKLAAAQAKKKKREFRPFRCHDLRHRFAIDTLKETGDIYRLSRILGHTSVKTTEVYLGYVDGEPARESAQVQRS